MAFVKAQESFAELPHRWYFDLAAPDNRWHFIQQFVVYRHTEYGADVYTRFSCIKSMDQLLQSIRYRRSLSELGDPVLFHHNRSRRLSELGTPHQDAQRFRAEKGSGVFIEGL